MHLLSLVRLQASECNIMLGIQHNRSFTLKFIIVIAPMVVEIVPSDMVGDDLQIVSSNLVASSARRALGSYCHVFRLPHHYFHTNDKVFMGYI